MGGLIEGGGPKKVNTISHETQVKWFNSTLKAQIKGGLKNSSKTVHIAIFGIFYLKFYTFRDLKFLLRTINGGVKAWIEGV